MPPGSSASSHAEEVVPYTDPGDPHEPHYVGKHLIGLITMGYQEVRSYNSRERDARERSSMHGEDVWTHMQHKRRRPSEADTLRAKNRRWKSKSLKALISPLQEDSAQQPVHRSATTGAIQLALATELTPHIKINNKSTTTQQQQRT